MTVENDGGPGFPTGRDYDELGGKILVDAGMSLRDYFAGLAMQGWLASYGADQIHPSKTPLHLEAVASEAYAMADAMLRAREAK